ncbi:hypothetical protein F5I97DRAFT_1894125 [Phlebopus sp. FC_14]|nr:hypothetical protein F5I97DRAFT_1894125 [Phlebopus sp. FC_14]
MISRKVLSELLRKPCGPYRDEDVLDKQECKLTSKCELVLYSFILEHDGKIVGLDDSERPLGGSGEDNRRFRFRGVLRIANPDWLSEFGLKTVEAELNLRASERAVREGERRGPPLTLESLFRSRLLKRSNSAWNNEGDDETKLNILVQGGKGLPAVFMQSSRAPTGLLWSTKDQNRQYRIATMHVATYSQSENFFWRWRLFALMKAIVKTSPPMPLHKQTPDWFAKMYLERFAYPTEDTHQRLIYDSADPDVDEQGNTQTPRQLLKVHKSEVLGLFASQAEWFVTNDAVRREKLLGLHSWDKFWRMVKKERQRAARRGVMWGWPIGKEHGAGGFLSSLESEGEELDKLVKQNPVTGKSH